MNVSKNIIKKYFQLKKLNLNKFIIIYIVNSILKTKKTIHLKNYSSYQTSNSKFTSNKHQTLYLYCWRGNLIFFFLINMKLF